MFKKIFPLILVFISGCTFEDDTYCPKADEVLKVVQDLDAFKTTDGLTLEQAVSRINNCQDLLDWDPKWSKTRACRAKLFSSLFTEDPSVGSNEFDLEQAKKGVSFLSELINFLFPAPLDAKYKIETLGGTQAVKVITAEDHQNTVLYLHGGGYVIDLVETRGIYMQFGGQLSKAADAQVWLLDIPVAPKVRFQKILDSAYTSYMDLIEKGVRPENIFIMGDSAGGGLAVSLLFKLRDEEKPMPAGTVVMSPWFDVGLKGDYSNAVNDPSMNPAGFKPIAEAVLQGDDPENPMISPLYGNLHDLGPLLIITGEYDGMLDDTRRFMKKAKAQGVDVDLEIGAKANHVYPALDLSEASVEAMHRIEDFTIEHAPSIKE